MIRELTQDEVNTTFFDLMIQIESSDVFDKSNQSHVDWLIRKISRRFGSGGRFYGCFLEDQTPVGLIALVVEDNPMLVGYAEALDLGVFEKFRNKGYGGQLLEHAEKLCRAEKIPCLFLSTYAAEYSNVAYYSKRGYVPVATLPDIHGPENEGQVYMRKLL